MSKKQTYHTKKRQANSNELSITVGVIGIFLVTVAAANVPRDMLPLFVSLLVLITGGTFALLFLKAFRIQRKTRAIQLSGVDLMDGFVFEKYVVQLLKRQGFSHVHLTEKYDLGIDIIADKDGERWGIQVKRNRRKTKAESVRQAVTALSHYKCTRAMVISNNFFTGAARQLANSNNCVLIDRSKIGQWIVDLQGR